MPPNIRGVAEFFRKKNSANPKNSEKTILIQSVEDPYYFCLFGSIISEIGRHGNFRVEQYISRSFHVNESKNFIRFTLFRVSNLFLGIKWVNAYKSFAPFTGIKFLKFNLLFDFLDAALAFKSYRLIQTHDELLALNIKNVYVGDLINDTYLRFKPSPRVALSNLYLLFIIWHAYRGVRSTQKYFLRTPPILFLTSYSTYLQHGIAVRVALLNGVQVHSFGNYQQFSKNLTTDDFYHTKNPIGYKLDFELLNDKAHCMKLSEDSFKRKIAGEVDPHFSYMKNSAYNVTELDIPSVRDASIVFLHDFFDSPHVYPDMVFHDFWEWICFTVDCLDSANIKYFIKPHPNQIGLNDGVLAALIRKYPHLKFISPKITNIQLIEGGIVSAITVYGSVAHEMAYFGIPSIACARHPHIAYSFCQTANSKQGYKKLIDSLKITQSLNTLAMRHECLEFYFMHNLNLKTSESDLLLVTHKLRSTCSSTALDKHNELVEIVIMLSTNDSFKEACKVLLNHVPENMSLN